MSSMNVCILLGRLKEDPGIHRHSSGADVATLHIEEIVVQRDRISGEPVERSVVHEVRVYNPIFVQTAKAEGARGRHVEVHGQLSYGTDGKAFVAVPSQGGRVAFKYFEVREVPSEPPAVVADHAAARELASAIPEARSGEPEVAPPAAAPETAAPEVAATTSDAERAPERDVPGTSEAINPSPAPEHDAGRNDRAAPSLPPARPGFGARPPQMGIVRPASAAAARPDPVPAARTQDSAAAPNRPAPGPANPPPVRPQVGSAAPRVGGAAPVAGVVQPRTPVGPRLGGPVTRPTMATRPAPARPGPIAAVAGRPAGAGGGIGRVGGAAHSGSSHMWRGQTEDIEDGMDDVPF